MTAGLGSAGLTRSPAAGVILACSAIIVGAVAALGMAWFMYTLIHNSEMRLSESVRTQLLDFVRVERSETSERRDRKPSRPQATDVPEAPPTSSTTDTDGAELAVNVSAPTDVGAAMDLNADYGIATGDGDYLPIAKVSPVYPRRALAEGITGDCMVRYTVTTAGTVKDVSVVEGACDHDSFARPSIEAAERFKYKPRVVDGTAVEVRGVRNVFHFRRQDEHGDAEQ